MPCALSAQHHTPTQKYEIQMIQNSAPKMRYGCCYAPWPGQSRQCGCANFARYRHYADGKAIDRGIERWPPTLDCSEQVLPSAMRFSWRPIFFRWYATEKVQSFFKKTIRLTSHIICLNMLGTEYFVSFLNFKSLKSRFFVLRS